MVNIFCRICSGINHSGLSYITEDALIDRGKHFDWDVTIEDATIDSKLTKNQIKIKVMEPKKKLYSLAS